MLGYYSSPPLSRLGWELLDLQTLLCHDTEGFLFQTDHLCVEPPGKLIEDKLEGVGHTLYAEDTKICAIVIEDCLERYTGFGFSL